MGMQIPTFGFLYVAGYIGYVGRQYLIAVKGGAKPTDKEIIIDVPLAVQLAWQGAGWPLAAVQVREMFRGRREHTRKEGFSGVFKKELGDGTGRGPGWTAPTSFSPAQGWWHAKQPRDLRAVVIRA